MNPFAVIFAVCVTVFIAAGIFTALAPTFALNVPTMPEFPTLSISPTASWLDAIGDTLYFIGSVIYYFLSFVAYMVLMTGTMLNIMSFGIFPSSVGTVISALVGVLLVGSLLMFLRGNSGGGQK